ncbi:MULTISPECIES: SGNH/GDSL hydrolase family protein [unclassified Anabaena]|uniref:SGNH/GDSL hydrolase family protein n=1 Tax=unclassified Anabaena TaxID=2619674 RepID=UPI00082C1CFD|nr:MULTISPECIES: SGNH/GDSL hydrolase family protein [unclassified Anabaena]
MKTKIIAAGFVIFSVMLPLEAKAQSFSGMYVFGDSLADTGNIFNLTNGAVNPVTAIPPSPPYYSGRFSNGPIWVDYVGQQLGLQPTLVTHILPNQPLPTQGINFAMGGANSGFGNAVVPNAPLPGVLQQVQGFVAGNNGQPVDPNALYAVVGGANDYLFPSSLSHPHQPKPYTHISQAVHTLAAAGAKNIVVFNLPDLGKLPGASLPGRNPADLTAATLEFNSNLTKDLATIRQNPNINLREVNVYSLVNRWRASPEKFGFSNVTDACFSVANATSCSNPNEYLFWDPLHPSSQAHKMIAEAVAVPEPSETMMTLALAAVGTLGFLKRQRQKSKLTGVGK